ncbi:MAG: hypothetical protein HFI75_10420 [Lachnospiraceae bacterium]|nr:hypothetical protein [Lachnospiraceae bacterium]
MKNFIRGMGVGILAATLILAVTYMLRKDDISDSEVIQRAKKLGMVEKDQSVIKENPADGESDDMKHNASGQAAVPPDGAEGSTPEVGNNTVPEPEPLSSEEGNVPAVADSEPPAEPQNPSDVIQVQINPGADGITVCQLLQEKGVIENASEFSRYLSDNDMQKYIMHGTYELSRGISYEELAQKIIRK